MRLENLRGNMQNKYKYLKELPKNKQLKNLEKLKEYCTDDNNNIDDIYWVYYYSVANGLNTLEKNLYSVENICRKLNFEKTTYNLKKNSALILADKICNSFFGIN